MWKIRHENKSLYEKTDRITLFSAMENADVVKHNLKNYVTIQSWEVSMYYQLHMVYVQCALWPSTCIRFILKGYPFGFNF